MATMKLAISLEKFLSLLTLGEQRAIAASNDPDTRLFLLRLAAAGAFHGDDPLVADGMKRLVAGGILTQTRADQIAPDMKPSVTRVDVAHK